MSRGRVQVQSRTTCLRMNCGVGFSSALVTPADCVPASVHALRPLFCEKGCSLVSFTFIASDHPDTCVERRTPFSNLRSVARFEINDLLEAEFSIGNIRARNISKILRELVDAIAENKSGLAPRPGLEPGTCGLTDHRSRHCFRHKINKICHLRLVYFSRDNAEIRLSSGPLWVANRPSGVTTPDRCELCGLHPNHKPLPKQADRLRDSR